MPLANFLSTLVHGFACSGADAKKNVNKKNKSCRLNERGFIMSDYCHRKAIRMKISEEEACKIFDVDMHPDARLDMEELLKAPFELAPTAEFFIDYNLPCSNDAEGDWGKTRALTDNEYKKYVSLFGELINHEYPILPCMLRLVEYCWYDCSEAPDYFDESTYHDDFYDEV